ncbi:MAG: TSUP family transporter, partial [Alphaproteobacteria bacterium]
TIPSNREIWAGPVFGAANGILTGMTGSFVVPGVMFLQAIGLPRDMLVQAMGMLFTVSTIALAIALQRNDLFSSELGLTSAAALAPAIAGMIVGQKIRHRLSEARFRHVFFIAILILGAYIIANAVLGVR